MRTLGILPFLLGPLAWAACGERPYTLETEKGLLGGEALSYDGEVLVFEGRACLEREGVYLEASAFRYLEAEGRLEARGLRGTAQGWELEAETLEGDTLRGARLRKGRLKAQVETLTLGEALKGQGVRLEAPAYRVRAEEGLFTPKEARLRGLLATPCPCGEDLRLTWGEARFHPETGEVVGDAELGLYGLGIPLREARANVNERPDLKVPLVFRQDPAGLTLGVEDLPLPRPGEKVGDWPLRFTFLLSQPPSGEGTFRLGLREGDKGVALRLGRGAGVEATFGDLFLGATPQSPSTPRLEARYTPRFRLGNLQLNPFLAYTETPSTQGWTLGLEGGYAATWEEGPYRLTLSPGLLLALYYPFQEAYAALGGSLGLAYGEGPLALEARYSGRYNPLRKEPPFPYERRGEFQTLSLSARYQALGLAYTLENPLGNRLDRLEARYAGEVGEFRLGLLRGSFLEYRLAYAMPLPERTCCQALWLAPEVGFGEGGLSRYGLTARYYDGCLAYELRLQNVLKGQYSEPTGLSLRFGVSLR